MDAFKSLCACVCLNWNFPVGLHPKRATGPDSHAEANEGAVEEWDHVAVTQLLNAHAKARPGGPGALASAAFLQGSLKEIHVATI